MILIRQQICMLITLGVLQTVNVQYAMPMYPMPPPPPAPLYMMPPPPPPPPVGIPFPYPVPVPMILKPKTTTTTKRPVTTTTKPDSKQDKVMAVPMPYPVPMPVPYAMAQAPYCSMQPSSAGCSSCPPCSCFPSCTPAFYSYCSPCHMQCRCRSSKNTFRDSSERDSSSTEDSRSCNDGNWKRKTKFQRRQRKRQRSRRFNLNDSEDDDELLVKPMLAYMSKDGDVKYQKRISESDAAKLMDKGDVNSGDDETVGTRRSRSFKTQQFVIDKDGVHRIPTK